MYNVDSTLYFTVPGTLLYFVVYTLYIVQGIKQCRLLYSLTVSLFQSGSGSMAAVRLHLLTSHGIDLDNPAMCVVEEKRYTREDEDLPSCSNLDMSGSSASCSPAHTPSSRYGLPYMPLTPSYRSLFHQLFFLQKECFVPHKFSHYSCNPLQSLSPCCNTTFLCYSLPHSVIYSPI